MCNGLLSRGTSSLGKDVVVDNDDGGGGSVQEDGKLGWAHLGKDVVVDNDDGGGGSVQENCKLGWAHLGAGRQLMMITAGQSPCCTLSLATAPCSYSAREFIKYPGVEGELLMQTPS